ncbi:MAG TPA: GH3 auxin-responsive promoter family protein [Gemmataceae bacterium]|jgi:hypothetical protein
MSLAGFLNTAWMLKCGREAWAFRRATRRVADTQTAILRHILHQNRETEFGRAHAFERIHDARSYQQSIPLSRYEDYTGAIERIAAGRQRVLTAERVRLLEPTSGTTGGEKLIPYTDSLRRQFQRAVAVWMFDLFRNRPAVRRGRAYWSISPALGPPRRTAGGIALGFDDDAAYLGTLERFALNRLLVVPSSVSRLADMESWRYRTLLHLLAAEDLALVSIWNPTFLPALLAPLERWAERLCGDLRPRRRGAFVEKILAAPLPLVEKVHRLWPRLALLSCWADAAAESAISELRALFPSVEIQPKGLLATEGCVTVPLIGEPAPALTIRCHFFEFQETDAAEDRARCRLAHELEMDGRYRVILTTGGGLYRYQLRDEVHVAGFLDQCPLLRFVGKADRVSDLVGEKLGEPHVRSVLDRVFATLGIAPRFALLAPVADKPPHYRLYVQTNNLPPSLQDELEDGLRENPYYRQAVLLRQLAPVEIEWLREDESAWRIYERHYLERGQKAGAIKPAALDAWTRWADEFRPLRHGASLASRS